MTPRPGGTRFARLVRLLFMAALPFVFDTCELVNSPGAVGGDIHVRFTGSPTLIVGRTLSPPVEVMQDGVGPIADPRYQIISSDPSVVEVQGLTLIPRKRGQAMITIRLVGSTLGRTPPQDSVSVNVIAAGIRADLTVLTLRSLGDTVTLVAHALDDAGAAIPAPIGWVSTAPAVATIDTASGKVTALSNGTTLMIAEIDGRKDTVTVDVRQQLVHFTFAPDAIVFNALGDTGTTVATPRDSIGVAIPPSLAPAHGYVSSLPSVASVSTQGKLVALANGVTYVRAVAGGVVDSMRVEVNQLAQQVVITGPDTVAIEAINDTTQLVALAFDARVGPVLNNKPVWQSRNLNVAVVDAATGLVRGLTVGSVRIVAALDNGADSVTVVVTNDPRRVVVSPDSVEITAVGNEAQLTGTPLNRLNVALSGIPVSWQVLDAGVATVDGQGKATGVAIGTTRIIATAVGGTLADTAVVVVTNLPDFIDILPTTATLASVGDQVTPAVDFRNIRGASLNRGSAAWSSKDPDVATVSSAGVIQARNPGTTFVLATNPANPARRDSIEITVTNAASSISLNRTLDTLTAPTKTLLYSAVVLNSRGDIIPGLTLTWRSTNPAVATVNATGLVTASGIGTDSIIVEVGGALGLRADTAVLVSLNVPATLTVNPTAASISAVGGTQQIVATARNDLGNIIAGLTVGWGSSNGGVANVSGTGLVTAAGPGTATITATVNSLSGPLSATTDITVVNPPDQVDITPAAVTLASVNDSTTPAVDFRTLLGDLLPRTAATWSSDDPAVASVTSGGIIIARGRGVTRVRATNPLNTARRDSVDVTVTNATVTVDLNRTDDTLTAPGRTIAYAATAFNARGNVVPDEIVTWTSRTPGVASVSAQGLATALTTGGTRIVAAVGAVADSAVLTVTNRAVSVELTPSPGFINTVGGTLQLVATARNDLGGIIASPVVTWGTGNGAVATVNGSGLVTGAGIGSTTISAAVDGVTAIVTVNVANDLVLVDILTPDTTLQSAGDTVTLRHNFRNSSNTALPPDVVDWRSSDPNVATVSGLGVLVAQARGVVSIKAVSPQNVGVADSITVTVADTPDSVALSRGDTTLSAVGRTLLYRATAFNARGRSIPNQAVTFVSRSPAVATIDAQGLAQAVGVGSARIVSLAGTVGDSATLTVTNNAVAVDMTPARDTILDLGGTLQLTVLARNDLGALVPGTVLTFSDKNPAVATTSATGLVTASATTTGIDTVIVQAPGGIRDTSFITVADAPRTLAITSGPVTLASVADQQTLAANIRNQANVVLPRNAVTWTSSAPTVVAVNDTGRVTALARGTATITATSPHEPTLTSSAVVTVTNAPVSVTLSRDTVRLTAPGRTFGLQATVRNAAGNPVTDTSVTWTAGAGSITVSSAGILTAVAVDTTSVTATVTGTAVDTTATVIVTNLPVSVSAALTAATLTSLQDTLYLKASARNDLGAAIPGTPARWTSSNAAIVGLGPNPGTAAALTQADSVRIRAQGVGQATVRARVATGVGSDSVDVVIAVTVRDDPTVVDLTGPTAVTLANLRRADTPAVNLRNALNTVLPRTAGAWSTTNASVAAVSSDGIVTAIGAGTAKIAVSSPGNAALTDTVTYTVEAPAYTITLDRATDSLTALTQTRVYTATVRDSLGNVLPGSTLTVAWTDANNGGPKVAFTPTSGLSTTATAAATTGATRATLTATVTPSTVLAGATLAASVNVGVGNDPASISVTPGGVTLTSVADSTLLTAAVLNNLGLGIAGRTLTWSTSNAGVVTFLPVGNDGVTNANPSVPRDTMRIKAIGTGSATITVTTGGVSTAVSVTVRDDPATVAITPVAVTLANLMRADTPVVNFRNALNTVLPRTAASWTTTNGSVATVSSSGVVTAVGAGTAKVAATSPVDPTKTDTVTYTVEAPAYTITLDKATDSLTALTQTRVYTATVRDSLGNVLPGSTLTVAWTDANNGGPKVAFTPTSGLSTTATAAATTGATRATLTATVTPSTALTGATLAASVNVGVGNDPASIGVTPSAATFTSVADSTLLTAAVLNNLGLGIAGRTLTWSTSNAGVVTFLPVGNDGVTNANPSVARDTMRIKAVGPGSATVTVTTGGVSGGITVTVTNYPATVTFVANDTTVAMLGSYSPEITLQNGRGVTLARTAASWSSTAAGVLTVSGAGLVTAVGPGSAYVRAVSPGDDAIRDSILVTVPNDPATVTLNRTLDTLVSLGQTLNYSAEVRNAAGQVIGGAGITWSTVSGGTIASITSGGTLTAVAVGRDSVFGTASNGTRDTAVVVVRNLAASVAASPSAGTITSVTDTVHLTPTVRNALGGAVTDTTVTWSVSPSGIVTVPGAATAAGAAGVVTAVAAGTANVTITVSGSGITTTVPVTVTNYPTTVTFVANDTTVTMLDTYLPELTLQNAVGGTVGRSSVTWLVQMGSVLSVSDTGRVTAVGPGTSYLWAVSKGNSAIRDSILVTVPNTPTSITLNRTADTLTAIGATLNYSAEVRNAAGGLIGGAAVTWSTISGGAIASIAANGILTAAAVGTDSVVGTTANGLKDTAQVVVQNLAATLSLSPSPVVLTSVGATQLVTGTVRNQLGGVIAGSSLDWATSNAGVVTVPGTSTTDNGTITAAGTGTATVTVTVTGTAIQAQLTVTVRDDPATVSFTSVDTTITAIGSAYQPGITIQNAQAATLARNAVTWGSTNSTVASVSTAGLVTAVSVGSAKIAATSPVDPAITDTITVTVTNVASAATSTISASPGSITANGTSTASVTVRLKNVNGLNLQVGGDAVVLSTTAGTLSSVTDQGDGRYTATLTSSTVAQTDTLAFTVNAAAAADSAFVVFAPGTATYLAITGSASQTAGDPQTITVTAYDAFGNTATGYTGDKSLTFSGANQAPDGSTNPTVEDKTGTPTAFGTPTTITFTAGVASRSMVLYRAESAVVSATDGPIDATGHELAVTVSAAALDNFAFSLASPQTNALAFTGTNTLTARDVYLNTKSTFDASLDNVTITADAPLAGVVSGLGSGGTAVLDQGSDFVGGVADLAGTLTYTGTATTGTFTATSASAKIGTSGAVTVNGGTATQLVITGSGTQTAGVGQTITITARDVSGNTAPLYAGDHDLTFSGASTAPDGTAPTVEDKTGSPVSFATPTTITFTAGVATRDMVLYAAESAVVAVTDQSISAAGGNRLSVTVSDAGLDNFLFSLASPQEVGVIFTGTNTLTARDAYENVVTGFDASADNVTISANAPLTGGSIQGLGSGFGDVLDRAGDFTGGVADLSGGSNGLTYNGTAATGTFTATSASAKTGTSNAVTMNDGPATQFAITGSGTQTAGASQSITITAYDAGGNVATSYDGDYDLTFSGANTAPDGVSVPTVEDKTGTPVAFGTPTTITFASGVASRNMVLYRAESALVNAVDGGVDAGGNELAVTVSDAGLDSFSWSLTSPQTTAVAFTGTNTLTALDAYENTVTGFDASGDNVTVTVAPSGTVTGLGSGGSDVLDQVADFVNGVANVTGTMTYTRAAAETSVTFTATSASAKTGTSAAITIDP